MAVVTTDPDRRHWTVAELREIPDDRNRYEIIDGELFVTPSPSWKHQDIAGHLHVLIYSYLKAQRLGNVLLAPADVELADDTVVEPDLFVVPLVEGKAPESWAAVGRLLLVIEILSPSTARVDRRVKRTRYQGEGVPEYWIVDGDAQVVERWRPEDERPEIISEQLEWRPEPSIHHSSLIYLRCLPARSHTSGWRPDVIAKRRIRKDAPFWFESYCELTCPAAA